MSKEKMGSPANAAESNLAACSWRGILARPVYRPESAEPTRAASLAWQYINHILTTVNQTEGECR